MRKSKRIAEKKQKPIFTGFMTDIVEEDINPSPNNFELGSLEITTYFFPDDIEGFLLRLKNTLKLTMKQLFVQSFKINNPSPNYNINLYFNNGKTINVSSSAIFRNTMVLTCRPSNGSFIGCGTDNGYEIISKPFTINNILDVIELFKDNGYKLIFFKNPTQEEEKQIDSLMTLVPESVVDDTFKQVMSITNDGLNKIHNMISILNTKIVEDTKNKLAKEVFISQKRKFEWLASYNKVKKIKDAIFGDDDIDSQ